LKESEWQTMRKRMMMNLGKGESERDGREDRTITTEQTQL